MIPDLFHAPVAPPLPVADIEPDGDGPAFADLLELAAGAATTPAGSHPPPTEHLHSAAVAVVAPPAAADTPLLTAHAAGTAPPTPSPPPPTPSPPPATPDPPAAPPATDVPAPGPSAVPPGTTTAAPAPAFPTSAAPAPPLHTTAPSVPPLTAGPSAIRLPPARHERQHALRQPGAHPEKPAPDPAILATPSASSRPAPSPGRAEQPPRPPEPALPPAAPPAPAPPAATEPGVAPEAARPPAGSADLVDRIVRVVEQQARLTPPRSVVVGLDGDRGRLAVTLRGTGIHLAWDGANLAVAEVRAFQRAVVAALASRGFEIAGDTPQDRSRREPARRQARHRRPARGQIH